MTVKDNVRVERLRQPFHIYQKELTGKLESLDFCLFEGNQQVSDREPEQYRTGIDPTEQDTGMLILNINLDWWFDDPELRLL